MLDFSIIIEALKYGFIWKAIIVGIMVCVSSSFLGVFLVLKRYSMIGDGLAHVSFAAIAIALFLGTAPIYVSIPLVVLASLIILKLSEKANINGDAAIGLVSSFSVAVGVMIGSISSGFNVDLSSYLFGNILLIENIDVIFACLLSIAVIFTIVFFFNSLFSITYDEEFSKVSGIKTKRYNTMLAILTSLSIVLGIRIVGTMLISSLLIFPTVSALQVARGFKQTIIYSCIISVLGLLIGLFLSILTDFPPGATIVLVNGIIFCLLYLYKMLNSR